MTDKPFFVIDKIHGRCLELGGDGSYQACQALLRELQTVFGAQFTEHLDCGALSGSGRRRDIGMLRCSGSTSW
jgi:hypothetical protein